MSLCCTDGPATEADGPRVSAHVSKITTRKKELMALSGVSSKVKTGLPTRCAARRAGRRAARSGPGF